jgi:uncharacterized protein YutE (UPF0331/DUF86 family)
VGKIERLVALVARSVEALDRLVETHGAGKVVEDCVLLNAALHLLQTSIQAVMDAAPPGRYSDVPRALRELGVPRGEDAGGAPPRRRL